jgi:hypothetical protein
MYVYMYIGLCMYFFNVWLTMHPDTTAVNYQLDAPFFYYYLYNTFTISLYMFRAPLCSSSGGQIVLYSIWYCHSL